MTDSDGVAQVRRVLVTVCADVQTLPADDDLIDSRLINSLTFISCIQNLVEVSGRDPDLDSVPIARLRTIAGLAEVFFPAGAHDEQLSA